MLFTDSLHKIAYSTDASVYREIPYGVAYPSSIEDICQLIAIARQKHTNLIARAGGTSIAGQVVGNGIVADVSKNLNHIIEINPTEKYAWVEPGVVRDELNISCGQYNLFFSPETSTSNRCCIGGMFGNNSCGTHSLVYGSTRQHILEAYGVLADGTVEHFREYTIGELEQRFGTQFWAKVEHSSLAEQIYSQLINFALDADISCLISDNYPDRSLTRRSCGYAIDEVIENLWADDMPFANRTINLCRLLAGSEGTLAFIFKIKVSLDPLPPRYVMTLCAHCSSLENAIKANLLALQHKPTAVELMDKDILLLSKAIRSVDSSFVNGTPAALLITELRASSEQELEQKANTLEVAFLAAGLVVECTRAYGKDVGKVWNLRKAGLGVLNSMKGDAKPTGVIEDTAVTPERFLAYMQDFWQLLERLNTKCVYYGHISTGELHLRPIINLKTQSGRQLFHQIAHETTLLVKKHRGTISGEHGDGRLRGEFIPLQYGEQTYQLMKEVKMCWDAQNIFNPGKIVDTPRMDEMLRADLDEGNLQSIPTEYNWKAAFDECDVEGSTGASSQTKAIICSVEQCNGAGDCRKSNLIGGTMCPAYKVSRDELHTTRARANILREYLYLLSQPNSNIARLQITNKQIYEVLSSCLACKGCSAECPSGVDIPKLRAEVLQQLYSKHGTPFRTYLVAHNAQIQQLGSLVPHLYNFFATFKPTAALLKSIVGFAQERDIPTLSINKLPQSGQFLTPLPSKGKIYLFADEFTTYQDAEIGWMFIELLNRLGYNVEIPKHVESGRAAISKGCLKQAKQYAEKNVKTLKQIISPASPLVGIEPSCILSFRDEYPDLVAPSLRDDAKILGENCLLFDEFIAREIKSGNMSPAMFDDFPIEIWLHGHCHQKSLIGTGKMIEMLQLLGGAKINVIPSGCCGMAGSFGYEKEHYITSIAIGEMILFPAVRKAVSMQTKERPVFISAPGTSCRQHIQKATGIPACHPIEILYKMLKYKK